MSKLTYNERALKGLLDHYNYYADKLVEDAVYESFLMIVNNAKKLLGNKPDLKVSEKKKTKKNIVLSSRLYLMNYPYVLIKRDHPMEFSLLFNKLNKKPNNNQKELHVLVERKKLRNKHEIVVKQKHHNVRLMRTILNRIFYGINSSG